MKTGWITAASGIGLVMAMAAASPVAVGATTEDDFALIRHVIWCICAAPRPTIRRVIRRRSSAWATSRGRRICIDCWFPKKDWWAAPSLVQLKR